jgi:purine-binding chemotaxis protein CheW
MTMSKTENFPQSNRDSRAGKYLTFGLGGEEYGFEIQKVREIIGLLATTAVPGMPDYMLGVINLRGKVIPVVDLRLKFGMTRAEATSETCIVVVDVRDTQTGVVVDRVSEVLDIRGEDIEDAPQMQGDHASNFILGLCKARGRVKILLEIGSVLADVTAMSPDIAV